MIGPTGDDGTGGAGRCEGRQGLRDILLRQESDDQTTGGFHEFAQQARDQQRLAPLSRRDVLETRPNVGEAVRRNPVADVAGVNPIGPRRQPASMIARASAFAAARCLSSLIALPPAQRSLHIDDTFSLGQSP